MQQQVIASYVRRKDMDSVLSCLVTDSLAPGPFCEKLAELARARLSMAEAVALRSSATAIRLALECLGLSAGDSVIASALSPSYYRGAVEGMGLELLLADVDPTSGAISPESARALAARGAKALLVHDALGILPDYAALSEIGLPMVEDISRSAGALYGDAPAGSMARLCVLGMEPEDMVTAGGGALLMASERREGIALRNRCADLEPELRMSDFNAALGLGQLKELSRGLERRREIASLYVQALLQGRHRAVTQVVEGEPSWFCFPVAFERGLKDARAYAKKKDVPTRMAFERVLLGGVDEGAEGSAPEAASCPAAASLMLRCLLFPLHPGVSKSLAAKVAKVIATLP